MSPAPIALDTAEQAEAAFYAALENGDLNTMAAVWMHSDSVVCVHPGGPQLLGYDQVLKSWRKILGNSGGFRISAQLLHHSTDDQVSVRFLNEILFTEDDQSEPFTVLATNAYQRTESGWRLILHHASPSPRTAEEVEDERSEQTDPDITLH